MRKFDAEEYRKWEEEEKRIENEYSDRMTDGVYRPPPVTKNHPVLFATRNFQSVCVEQVKDEHFNPGPIIAPSTPISSNVVVTDPHSPIAINEDDD